MEISDRDILSIVRTVMRACRSRAMCGMSAEGALEVLTSWVLVLDDPWWEDPCQTDYPVTCLWEVTWIGGPDSAEIRITGLEQWSAGERMTNPPVTRFYSKPNPGWPPEFREVDGKRTLYLLRSGQWFGDRRLAEQELRMHLTEYSV
jgi:hypothetical protein